MTYLRRSLTENGYVEFSTASIVVALDVKMNFASTVIGFNGKIY